MGDRRFTVRELAKSSGVSLASIKYYLREGLLPPGDSGAEQRRYYDQRHLARLKAIRALRDVGGLPIAAIFGIFQAIDQGGRPFSVVARAIDALGTEGAALAPATKLARDELRSLLARMGVKTRRDAGALLDLASALVRIRELWSDLPASELLPYARAARSLAHLESRANRAAFAGDTEALLGTAVLGTVLFEPVLISLRRLMHEHFAGLALDEGARKTRARRRRRVVPRNRWSTGATNRAGRRDSAARLLVQT